MPVIIYIACFYVVVFVIWTFHQLSIDRIPSVTCSHLTCLRPHTIWYNLIITIIGLSHLKPWLPLESVDWVFGLCNVGHYLSVATIVGF